jgi:PQQ-dependent catabolism-associated CXXCW motif protein
MTTVVRCTSIAAIAVLALAASPAIAQDSFGESAPAGTRPAAAPFPPAQQAFPAQPPPARSEARSGAADPSRGFGQPPANAVDPRLQGEREDFGVPATAQLHDDPLHGPTPVSILGGQVITTQGLAELLRGGERPVLLLDVLGGAETIQGAQHAVPAAAPGSFDDQTQQQFGQYLEQATGGDRQHVIALYCLSPQCWMSYNAALRAIHLGYTNVLWYRGGIESWKQAGLPVQRGQ